MSPAEEKAWEVVYAVLDYEDNDTLEGHIKKLKAIMELAIRAYELKKLEE